MKMNDNMGIIYILENKMNNKHYVGQTIQSFNRRISNHKSSNSYIGKALHKNGVNNFNKLILENVPEEELDYWEQHYIQECNSIFPNGYNFENGGHKHKHHCEETIKKFIGHKVSKETRKKISKSHKNIHPTEETKQKMSKNNKKEGNPNFGKHHTEKAKRKMSEANKGKIPWNKGLNNCYSKETIQKMSNAKKEYTPWIKGRHHTEETKIKMRKPHKRNRSDSFLSRQKESERNKIQ
jgi:group I intron endonuclease